MERDDQPGGKPTNIKHGHATRLSPVSISVPGLDKPLLEGPTSSASLLTPSVEQIQASLRARPRPKPLGSIIASASKISKKKVSDPGYRKALIGQTWQEDAWAMYDLVGELRFLTDTLASRSSKAHFFVGEVTEQGESVTLTDNEILRSVLDSIGDGSTGLGRLVERLVANLKIAGEGWLVGIPHSLEEQWEEEAQEEFEAQAETPYASNSSKTRPTEKKKVDRSKVRTSEDAERFTKSLDNYTWRLLSVSEIEFLQSGMVKLNLGPSASDQHEVNPDELYLIRTHKPHPRFHWQADSPVRSSLPVLRELVGLTMHISAQIDSRLAGAGVFIVPESYSRAVKRSMGLPDDSPEDPVTEGLMQAMLTPIGDRSAASAFVPLVLTVPDESADRFRHLTFDKGLDTQAISMREEAIRRYALGADAPPDLLLGQGTLNHWGVWLTREDVVRAHIEPTLALVCDAITTQFLRPLIRANFPKLNADKYVVWYDVEHLIIRPSVSQDAKDLFDRGELNGESLRKATGFDESDAPEESDIAQKAVDAVFEMMKANPGLMRRPGLDVLVRQTVALLEGTPLGGDDMVAQAAQAQQRAETIEEKAGVDVEAGEEEGEGGESSKPAPKPTAPPASNSNGSAAPRSVGPPAAMALNITDLSDMDGLRGSLSSAWGSDDES